jgi:hypothetical protein
MRSITMVVGALIFCAITPISANAKTDGSTSKCEKRCHEYYCVSNPNPMYCHRACHHKCSQTPPSSNAMKNRYAVNCHSVDGAANRVPLYN